MCPSYYDSYVPVHARRIMEERKKQADEQRAAMKIRQYMQKACAQ